MKRNLGWLLVAAVAVLGVHAALADTVKKKAENKPQTIIGEIVDTGCYGAHGARGIKHKECADKCIANGMPMALLTKEGKLYLMTMDHDNADPYNKAKTLAASTVAITGTVMEVGGMRMIEVNEVKAQ